jgi:hypothetical protein
VSHEADGFDFEDDDDDDDPNHELVYLKYHFEGASTIPELQRMLRGFANYLDCQLANGWQLADEVDGGWVHLARRVG